ncbi:MAG TPA: GTP diphosphokinase [Gammaproteobacteria bacterium]|nr:GTP diphosphokinase [Gammaproteobacteria bacterium]
MKKTKPTLVISADNTTHNIESWMQSWSSQYPTGENSLIRQACALAQLTGTDIATPNGQSCLLQGLQIAAILSELKVDQETMATGIIYSNVRYAGLILEDVQEQLGADVARLTGGVKKMEAIQNLQEQIGKTPSHNAIDNFRKMLLAMVDDVRIVLIKLAERLVILRHIGLLSDEEKRREAKMTQDIYAPLANRLGIGHLKWELEDLSFRYLEPEIYKNISKALKSTRIEREHYVHTVMTLLERITQELGITKTEVTGRAKHIYSIYKKMQRKNVALEEIYDAIAFRILVPTIEDCYAILGHVHSLWKPITKEFDDYIVQPKANGYRSIHTAVIGPDDKAIEIQIRTFDMHQEAELGVAAHWIYKEGGLKKAGYEAKIAWLRQVLDWQQEVTQTNVPSPSDMSYSQALDDRIYVFTPQGDVVELPKEATPLDFAYHIHSEIGHRTRGAKVNAHIVPLTYHLKIGECVEILTAKEGHPSRDWLNPNLGYLKTARAKAKVHHWFRQLDAEKNLAEGQTLVEKELRRLGLKGVDLMSLAKQLNFTKPDELYIAIGRGDITLNNLVHTLQEMLAPDAGVEVEPEIVPSQAAKALSAGTDIDIQGVGNLLTHMASCCKPIPGDAVIGYITQGHGVSIHRQDCANILHINEQQKNKLIEVSWGIKTQEKYAVDLVIHAYDRHGLIRDLTQLLVNEHISIIALNTYTDKKDQIAKINISIEIHGLTPLSRVVARISQITNVTDVKRV